MIDFDEVLRQIHNFFLTYQGERGPQLDRDIQACLNNLNSRNILNSSITGGDLAKIYSTELTLRINLSWKLTRDLFDRHNVLFEQSEIAVIESKIKEMILSVTNLLKKHPTGLPIYRTLNRNFDNLKQINTSLTTTFSGLNSKISGELQLYKKFKHLHPKKNITEYGQKTISGSIFLSHNHSDKAFVHRLAQRLGDSGVITWIDDAEMLIGDSLLEKIQKGICEMEYLGIILSPNSVESEWVKR